MSKESRRARNAARTGSAGSGSTGPSGSPRAGRRDRIRRLEEKPFLERYRGLLIGVAVALVAAGVIGITIVQTTRAAYTCTIVWDPAPTPSPAAGASPRIGYAQDDMGALHQVARPQKYTFCPPASGNHYNNPGTLGPIVPKVYKPTDQVGPPNWIHNLEHGGLVILYRGDSEGATEAGLQKFQAFFDSFPPSPICKTPAGRLSPVIARFDEMKWPYAALLWHRVLPLPEWNPDLALQFYAVEDERLDANGVFITPPEPQCLAPSQSAAPSESVAPSASASSSASPSGSAAAPGSVAPSPSASPSPS